MYTCCPNCSSVFQVSAGLLAEAGGDARCGECRHVFNVFDALYDDLSSAREALTMQRRTQVEAASSDFVSQSATVDDADDEVAELTELSYPPVGWQQQTVGGGHILSAVGIFLLLVLLGGQWVWFNRTALAAEPAWRPRVEQFCTLLDCRLPLPADLAQLVLLSRDVSRHPEVDGALLIHAEFENRAGFAQRYPVFEVSFTDRAGKAVAARRFRPSEYLDADTDITAGLNPGNRVKVVLEVLDPADSAASYRFEFL